MSKRELKALTESCFSEKKEDCFLDLRGQKGEKTMRHLLQSSLKIVIPEGRQKSEISLELELTSRKLEISSRKPVGS